MTVRTALAAGLLGLLCASAAHAAARSQDEAAAPPKITGSVAYRERIALPPDAVVQVRLDDASQPEAPPTLVAETTVPTAGKQVPISFELPYRAADILPNRRPDASVGAQRGVIMRSCIASPASMLRSSSSRPPRTTCT